MALNGDDLANSVYATLDLTGLNAAEQTQILESLKYQYNAQVAYLQTNNIVPSTGLVAPSGGGPVTGSTQFL